MEFLTPQARRNLESVKQYGTLVKVKNVWTYGGCEVNLTGLPEWNIPDPEIQELIHRGVVDVTRRSATGDAVEVMPPADPSVSISQMILTQVWSWPPKDALDAELRKALVDGAVRICQPTGNLEDSVTDCAKAIRSWLRGSRDW